MVEPRQARQAVLAQQRQMDGESQGAKARIGADVAGRLFAADMLLAGGQGQHKAAPPFGIHRLAAQAARHLAQEFLAGGEQAHIRPAEIQTVADGLAFRRHNIRALRAGRLQQTQRYDFRHHRDQQRALGMSRLGDGPQVADQAEHIRRLHHHTGGILVDQSDDVLGLARRDRDAGDGAEQARHRLHRLGIMGMQAARQDRLAAFGDALGHQHRFGGGGGTVIERGVGHLHAGQQRHLGLELEQILQRALGDFRLVGRVAGEEFRALDQVIHRAGHMVLVGARTAEEWGGPGGGVLRRHLRQRALHFHLALGVGQIEGGQRDMRRPGHVAEQRVHIRRADPRQHGAAVVGGQRQIAHPTGSPRTWHRRRRPSACRTRPCPRP